MTLRSLGIIRPKDVPPIETILVEAPQPRSPYGIKGVGEIGLVPTAGAVAGALHDLDGDVAIDAPDASCPWASAGRRRVSRARSRAGAGSTDRAWRDAAGIVCGHHHLYSALARGMPAPPRTPRQLPRDPRARLVAARPRPRPRDDQVVGDARRSRGARAGNDGDRRPSRLPECDRGLSQRHRGRLRRGRHRVARAATR